jgi:hypothetical protein
MTTVSKPDIRNMSTEQTSTISNASSNHTDTVDGERGAIVQGIIGISIGIKYRPVKDTRLAFFLDVILRVLPGR